MPKCKRCGEEMTLREFERYKDDEESYTYSCESEGCPLEGKKRTFSKEENNGV